MVLLYFTSQYCTVKGVEYLLTRTDKSVSYFMKLWLAAVSPAERLVNLGKPFNYARPNAQSRNKANILSSVGTQ